MKRLIIAAMLAFASIAVALAQSPTILSMAQAELDKRGLKEAEVRSRLMEEGIDVDKIHPSEYAFYQDRVLKILDQMQTENATRDTTAVDAKPALKIDIPQTTPQEAKAETEQEETIQQLTAAAPDDIYGHALFSGNSMGVFRTTDGALAPDTYVLGEGDEVHISIFGSSQTEIHQRIAHDGSIQPNGATKIFLKGMTLSQGRAAIRSRLSHHYSFRRNHYDGPYRVCKHLWRGRGSGRLYRKCP